MTGIMTVRNPGAGTRTAAMISAGILAATAALQAALAAGVPWGGIVWGGADTGILTGDLRVASGVVAVVLGWMALVLLARGGVIQARGPIPSRYLGVETWGIAGLMAINTIGNLASGNLFEQLVFAPAAATVAVCAGVLALRGVDPAAV